MNHTGLTPWQWRALEVILPPNPRVGRPYRDHRRVIEGILWRLHNCTPWRAIPELYGPQRTCHARLLRWQHGGTWERLLHTLHARQHASIDWARLALDTTHVKAHRSGSGARRPAGDEALGRSCGGHSSKLHLVVDQRARPLAVLLTAGQASDEAHLGSVLDRVRVNAPGPGRPRQRPTRLLVDRAFGARAYRQQTRRLGIGLVCPERQAARRHRLAKGARGGRPPAFDREV